MKNLKISTVSQQDVPETSQIFDINPITGEIIIATNNHLIFPESGKQIAFENQENLPIILLSVKNEQVLILLANGSGFGWMEGAEAAEFLEICDICHSERASAEWSPDEQILAISDGNALFFIDPSLTPFYERILSFNDDELHVAPVTVGWGSESTQFRGSAGKLKAGEKIEKERVELKTYSKKSSVCWRFDGEFLGVSYFSEVQGTRMLTIFDKNGAVQSSMNIRNIYLSDCFAMRPNANLICSSVLKEDGLDEVVFFERNGETRNGYLMKWSKNQTSKRRIKQISWNSTGSILAFHVICGEEEFLQFWRLSNYEFTQKITWKLEISSNFTFKWSTMDENVIYVLENGKFWNFSIFESSSYSQDLEMNLVVATDEIRISDLCKRAIPPPMCENSLNFEADVVFYRILEKKIHVLTADAVIHQFAQSANTTNFQKIQTSLLQNPSKEPIVGFTYDSEAETYAISKNIDFSESGAIQVYNVKNSKVWLTSEAALYIDETKIASNIISILPKENDLMVIDFENKLRFVDFENLRFAEDVRDVEAGCELVSADSATANVVLQAARGNLETIQPRRFVIREIKRLLDEKLYIAAFKFMKKHRIDMNFAMDYKKETLSADAETWLQNTCDSQLLEQLIVSCTEQKSEEGNELCTKVYEEILKIEDLKRKTKLFPLLLTSLLRSTPSRINDSLKEIQEFVKDVEDRKDVFTRQSLHHVSFFVPAKELFNCALSTYDLKLAQKVAEASNYDPKEYLPILNRLNKFENELEKQYRINLVRENWVDCLKSLFVLDKSEQSESEENWWKEAEEIIERENLYEESLKIANSRDEKRYGECCELYAKYLEKKFLWKEAAMFFELAGDLEKTLKSWEMSRDVDGLISAARRAKIDFAKLKIHAIKMSSALRESRQLKECAKALKLANSPNFQIVQVLCEAQEWLLASREVEEKIGESLDKSQEILRNSAISRCETLKIELMRRSAEFERYRARLQIVRENKLKKLEQFAAGEIEDLRDDISMISSISSRSGSSKVSMASTVRRRKQIEKKKNSLKEGGEYEDSALLNVLAENYTWMQQTRGEIAQLLPVLIISGKMRESLELRDSAEEFTRKLVKSKISIWPENLAIQYLPGPLYSVLDPNLEPSPVPMPPVFRLEPELIPPNFNFPVIFP